MTCASLQERQLTRFTKAQIDSYLASARIPLRLACTGGSGCRRVLSLWYVWLDAALWCATSPRARIRALLRRELRCGFEAAGDAPPYRGVRGPGRAWLEFEVVPEASRARIRQTALFDRVGLAGLAYGYGIDPLHRLVLSGMLRGIGRAAVQ